MPLGQARPQFPTLSSKAWNPNHMIASRKTLEVSSSWSSHTYTCPHSHCTAHFWLGLASGQRESKKPCWNFVIFEPGVLILKAQWLTSLERLLPPLNVTNKRQDCASEGKGSICDFEDFTCILASVCDPLLWVPSRQVSSSFPTSPVPGSARNTLHGAVGYLLIVRRKGPSPKMSPRQLGASASSHPGPGSLTHGF